MQDGKRREVFLAASCVITTFQRLFSLVFNKNDTKDANLIEPDYGEAWPSILLCTHTLLVRERAPGILERKKDRKFNRELTHLTLPNHSSHQKRRKCKKRLHWGWSVGLVNCGLIWARKEGRKVLLISSEIESSLLLLSISEWMREE